MLDRASGVFGGPVFVMRTIQRHHSGARGDFRVTCDYCGFEWMRSRCKRDGAGLLACPLDMDGKDAVTLSQENAAGAVESLAPLSIRDGGNIDKGGDNYAKHPLSILTDPLGWWQPQQAATVGAVGVQWIPNLVNLTTDSFDGADVKQPDPALQPLLTDDEVVFSGDRLRSDRRNVQIAAEGVGSFWCVGSFDGTSNASMFAVTDIPLLESVGGISLHFDSTANTVTASAVYRLSGGPTTVTVDAPLTDTSLHLFVVIMEDSRLRLRVDTTEVETSASATDGFLHVAADEINYGGSRNVSDALHHGKLNEAVVIDTSATDTEVTEMQAYFKLTYPELSL